MLNFGAKDDRVDSDPAWSPDSKTLAVFSTAGEKDQAQLWTVNADGSGLTQLTFDSGKSRSRNPSYSPDGTKIIFVHLPSTGGRDLFTMNPDGSGVTQVTRTATDESFPQWAVAN